MCCFSQPVDHVSATKIFARPASGGWFGRGKERQFLVYSMNFAAATELAMILPLPVPPGCDEGALKFVSLQGYDDFFDDLDSAFPEPPLPAAAGFAAMGAPQARSLQVHKVGQFEASFVPSITDFARLDPRFSLSPDVWSRLPKYADWGFAVFKLQAGSGHAQQVHPMAFSFPRRDPNSIFFPTVHVHDGQVNDKADFDHSLYLQDDGVIGASLQWWQSDGPLSKHVDVGKAKGLIAGDRSALRAKLNGQLPNTDVVLTPPTGIELTDLQHVDRFFELRLRASWAYVIHTSDPRIEYSRTKLPQLRGFLIDGLAKLTSSQIEAWDLCRYDASVAEHQISVLQRQPAMFGGVDLQEDAPIRIQFYFGNQRIEPQAVGLTFRRPPTQELAREIEERLKRLLEQAPT